MKIMLVLSALALLSGCVPIAKVSQPYCETFSPLEQAVFRARMDEQTKPHEVRINCHAFSNQFADDESGKEPVAAD